MSTVLDSAGASAPSESATPPPNAPARAKKKSRFNRPAWAAKIDVNAPPPPDDTVSSIDVRRCDRILFPSPVISKDHKDSSLTAAQANPFSRTKETLSYLQRQQEEERIAKKLGQSYAEDTTEPQKKKPRLDSEGPSDGEEKHLKAATVKAEHGSAATTRASRSASPRKAAATNAGVKKGKSVIIDLSSGDEDEVEDIDEAPAREQPKATSIPALSAQADEAAAYSDEELYRHPDNPTRRSSQASAPVNENNSQTLTPDPTVSLPATTPVPGTLYAPSPQPSPPKPTEPDIALNILIDCRIPNTEPLIVQRKLTQRLKEVRDAWLNRQPALSDSEKKDIYLTWRGQKIYGFTTCQTLGIKVDEAGKVWFARSRRSGEFPVEPAEENAQIAFEAVTDEMVRQEKREKEEEKRREIEERDAERRKAAGLLRERSKTGTPAGDGGEAKPGLRVILKARGQKDYKLKVKPVGDADGKEAHLQSLTRNRQLRSRK